VTQDSETRDNGTSDSSAHQDATGRSLRQSLPGHFRPTTEEFDRMWEEGMFVVDTNVLLNLYRYSRSTRDELLRVLRALENKLFLPHQVGREFLERRLEIVRKQREGFSNLRQRVTGVRREMETELRKVLRLRPGEDLPDGLRNALEEIPLSGYGVLSGRLEALETDLPQPSNSPDDDEVWAAVEELVAGKVGPPYGNEEMHEAEAEAERRRSDKIPPGFKDQRPGDYVLWRQTIDAAKRSGRPVVLITDDRKEDWWWIEHGETIGPRSALVAEMRKEAGVHFYMYTPDRLMSETRERLDIEVSDKSISEAEGLGREPDDEATSEAGRIWFLPDDMLDTTESLTDTERVALRAFVIGGYDFNSVAEELGSSRDAASRLVEQAIDKVQNEVGAREPHRYSLSESNQRNVRRFLGQRNSPLKRTETLIDSLSVTVRGYERNIDKLINTLLRAFPDIDVVSLKPSEDALGDGTLELTFRTPVTFEHTRTILEETARATGVVLSSLSYSRFGP
jgi:predicted nucleic acid-binding protein